MNPLDELSWEQRFWAAFDALVRMEARAELAEHELLSVYVVQASPRPVSLGPPEPKPRRGRPPKPFPKKP